MPSSLIVTVEKILDIQPIPGADRIVLATVKGWKSIIGKDQFKVGDLCVYIPIDSVLPDKLIEEQNLTFLKGKNRVRTLKLKGVISQGLILPITILELQRHNRLEGDNVAIELGITKYEVTQKAIVGPKKEYIRDYWIKYLAKEITLRRFVAKSVGIIKTRLKKPKLTNTEFKKYTDIENIKHFPVEFEEGEEVIITEKIHGTNFRASNCPVKQTFLSRLLRKSTHEFCYGSHNVQKTVLSGNGFYGEDVYGQISKKYNLKDILPKGYQIFGEIYGPKIQKLTYGKDEIDVVFFDLMIDGKYVDWQIFKDFCELANLPTVPILFKGEYYKSLLNYTEGPTILGKGCHIREGAVIKPLTEKYSNKCGRKILKSISSEYLLTKDEDNEEFSH